MKKILWILIILGILGFIVWAIVSTKTPTSDIVSRSGIHWHPSLTIYVQGEKIEIPSNIGLENGHNPVHTHDEDAVAGVIHLEFQGLVRKDDIMLGQFFKAWNKNIDSFGSNMKMTVNGKENTEYANYVMHENDKIELRFD